MPKKKEYKSYNLYYKGKIITKGFKDTVKETARIKKIDVSTPEKLKDFYNTNKSKFASLFEIGIDTSPSSTTKVFKEFQQAEDSKKEFYFDEFGEKIPISAKQAKFELAKLEHQLNIMFEATGVEFSYRIKLDNTITIILPTEEELEMLQSEPVELINDYLSAFGIKIYLSDPSQRKKTISDETRNKRNKQYSDRINKRFKQYRKEYNIERKKKSIKRKSKSTNRKKK